MNYGAAVLKSFAILYLIAARDTLYKPFAFRSVLIINSFGGRLSFDLKTVIGEMQ